MQKPYKETFIKNLKNNSKAAVSGFIVDKNENSIVINDNTGNLPVIINTDLKPNNFVRVFGYYINGELQAHLVQDLNTINKNLYIKFKMILNQKQ